MSSPHRGLDKTIPSQPENAEGIVTHVGAQLGAGVTALPLPQLSLEGWEGMGAWILLSSFVTQQSPQALLAQPSVVPWQLLQTQLCSEGSDLAHLTPAPGDEPKPLHPVLHTPPSTASSNN